ncbi:MAG: hypothetical protein JXA21_13860 [Anaerolineae bacterium]|nr:hypothetical protein [Anaerolineae bacterium]
MKSKRKLWLIAVSSVLIVSSAGALLAYLVGWTPPGIQPSGPTLTPNPLPYASTPEFPFWMSEEKREKKIIEWQTDLESRAQSLYDGSTCTVLKEITNPLFTSAFPRAHLYEVGIRFQCEESMLGIRCVNKMASFEGKEYRMPEQFNELMYDAGYKLTNENFDKLTHALIAVSVPTGVAMRSITCEKSQPTKELISPYNDPPTYYIYVSHCQLAYENLNLTVKFPESVATGQFRSWSIDVKDGNGDWQHLPTATSAQLYMEER